MISIITAMLKHDGEENYCPFNTLCITTHLHTWEDNLAYIQHSYKIAKPNLIGRNPFEIFISFHFQTINMAKCVPTTNWSYIIVGQHTTHVESLIDINLKISVLTEKSQIMDMRMKHTHNKGIPLFHVFSFLIEIRKYYIEKATT